MILRVIIADRDQELCAEICNYLADSKSQNFHIVAIEQDGGSLLAQIECLRPDVVITDIDLPLLDGLSVIKYTREKAIPCRFIILTNRQDFFAAHAAITYKVDAYLLKPLKPGQLMEQINGMVHPMNVDYHQMMTPTQVVRCYFIEELARKLIYNKLTVNEINRMYGTNFKGDSYQSLYIKIDIITEKKYAQIPYAPKWLDDAVFYTHKALSGLCHDIIINTNIFALKSLILLNYASTNSDAIQEAFLQINQYTKHIIPQDQAAKITLCISRTHFDVHEIIMSEREAGDAMWSRFFMDNDGIVSYPQNTHDNCYLQSTIDKFNARIHAVFETSDAACFASCIEEIFALPFDLLMNHKMRIFIKHIPETFLEAAKYKLSATGNIDRLLEDINQSLETAPSAKAYMEALIAQISALMIQIIKNMDHLHSPSVAFAMKYIEKNYNQQIQLTDIAEQASHNPSYLSAIFKKEIGENFTEYVNKYRISISKDLLRNTNLKIREIAEQVGFLDPCYFNRIFKKIVGKTPLEYRKLLE